MKLKQSCCCLLALWMALWLCGCQLKNSSSIKTETGTADGAALYGHGLELAGLLEEMLGSPEYFALMGGSDRLGEVIDPLRGASLSAPEGAYLVTLPEDTLPLLMDAAEVDLEGFSEPLQAFLERRMFNSVPTMLNSRQGAELLAAASILTVSDAWAGETLEQNCFLLLSYPDACPVMVSFCGREGLVEGTATLLLGEPLEEGSIEAVSTLFLYLGMEGVQAEKLETSEE